MQERRPVALEAGRDPVLRLCCVWRHDRYAHAITRIDRQSAAPLLASIEGDPTQHWPSSPPLQSLTCGGRAGSERRLLLVGMAAAGHWSVTIEVDARQALFVFDVACRLKDRPAWLGSRYRREGQGEEPASAAAPGGALAAASRPGLGDAELQCEALPVAGQFARVLVTPQGFDVRPQCPLGPFPQTVRWRYQIGLWVA